VKIQAVMMRLAQIAVKILSPRFTARKKAATPRQPVIHLTEML
jgi:hypothetical protein